MSAFNLGSIRAVLGLDEKDYTTGLLNAQAANEIFGHSVTNFINNPLLGTIGLFKNAALSTASLVAETAKLNQEYVLTSQRVGVTAALELLNKVQAAAEKVADFFLENPSLGWTATPALMLARDAFVEETTLPPGSRGAREITLSNAERRERYEALQVSLAREQRLARALE